MIGVITDLGFPKNGEHTDTAGLQLSAHIKECTPEMPVLMQSMQPDESSYASMARDLGLKYVCKSSSSLLQSLREFMIDDLMFGPLKFQDGVTGQPIGQVKNVTEMMKVWAELPLSSIAYHARYSHLSRWFTARAEFQLAKRFRASQVSSPTLVALPNRASQTVPCAIPCAIASDGPHAIALRTWRARPPPSSHATPPAHVARAVPERLHRRGGQGTARLAAQLDPLGDEGAPQQARLDR